MRTFSPLADDEPLTLPVPPPAAAGPAAPLLAALIPIAGALGLWAMTGSALTLWFAALGPLLLGASALDGRRAVRRDRRRYARELREVSATVARRLDARHDAERAQLERRHPDAAAIVLRDEIWRPLPGRSDSIRVGRGDAPSVERISGGDGSTDAERLRGRAAVLPDAPILIPAATGIAVVGPATVASAVARSLALQLCTAMPPAQLRVTGRPAADGGWSTVLPHRRSAADRTLQLCAPGEPPDDRADLVIAVVPVGTPPPHRCAAVLTLTGLGRARLDWAGESVAIRIDALSRPQAAAISALLVERAGRQTAGGGAPVLAELIAATAPSAPGTLPAVVGTADGEPVVLDIVADGPHAIVTGVTGSGKSELLTSWIVALSSRHTSAQVAFLLADFKGGRAFDALAPLPHVTGVLTDLDERVAQRAMESLRAELRHRERVLAQLGARDIDAAAGALPRLVIVIDEYAALVDAFPEFADLLADIAARGRALGLHLILATQRATGVFRGALLANCPLRVSLRVTDAADSRLVLGTDDAAALSGEPDARGTMLVRRAGDARPFPARVALCPSTLIAAAADGAAGPPARRPWLPDLPDTLPLASLRDAASDGSFILGRADEPDRQRQPVVGLGIADRGLLVVGGPGAGRSNVLALVAAQHDPARTVVVPRDPEKAWDAVAELDGAPAGTVVLVDDADALLAGFGPEHVAAFSDRLEAVTRDAGARGLFVVVAAQRFVVPVPRLAALLPHRLVLRMPSRADRVAVGGEARGHDPQAPPGRGELDGRTVQAAWTDATLPSSGDGVPLYVPAGEVGFVAPDTRATRAVLAAWERAGIPVARLGDESPGSEGVLWGEPDAWLRDWRALAGIRARGALLIDAACAAEVRALTSSRALPPYAAMGRARAWLFDAGDPPVRVRLA